MPCKQLTLYFAREHKEEAIPSPKVNAKSVYTRDNLQTYFSIFRWRLFFHRLFIFNFSGGRRRGRGLKKGNKIKITQKLIDKNVSLKIVRIVFLLGGVCIIKKAQFLLLLNKLDKTLGSWDNYPSAVQKIIIHDVSLPADVLWGSFVTHSCVH